MRTRSCYPGIRQEELKRLKEFSCSAKQESRGDVSQFYQRLKNFNYNVLGVIHNAEGDPEALDGQLLVINDITAN